MKKIVALILCVLVALAILCFLPLPSFPQGATAAIVVNSKPAAAGGGGPVVSKTGGTGTTTATCNSSTTTCVLTYTPNASGDWLIVGVPYTSTHVPTTVTDNGAAGGSTYVQLTGVATANINQRLTLFCTTALAASVTTITANGGGVGVMVIEGSGGTAPCTIDQANSTANTTTATSWSSGATSATTNANDISVGFSFDANTQAPTWTGTNGYTSLNGNVEASDGWGISLCYKILSATGAQTATGTVGGVDSIYTAIWVLE